MHGRLIRVAFAGALAMLPAAAVQAAAEQDPVLQEFATCDSWYQAPTQPGTTVVACDQAQLDRFIASGLTDGGPGGAVLRGPDGRYADVPSVYDSEDPRDLRSVRVTGTGAAAGVYAATLRVDGVLRQATFPATALPNGTALRIRWNATTAQLLTPAGAVVATGTTATTHGSRFRMLPMPRGLHARRIGRDVVVSWPARAGTGYALTAGAHRGTAGADPLKSVPAGAAGRRRVVVRVPARDHWIGLRALRGETMSRMVASRPRG